jgi:hypothetical protein
MPNGRELIEESINGIITLAKKLLLTNSSKKSRLPCGLIAIAKKSPHLMRSLKLYNLSRESALARLLQPLEVPSMIWSDIAMDFVESFLHINDKSVILTVVDRLSKYVHFISLGHPYTSTSLTSSFNCHRHSIPKATASQKPQTKP